MRRTGFRVITMIAVVLGLATAAVAETSAEDAAKYRQSIMKALSGHNGAISMMARGKAGDPKNLGSHVDALLALTGEVKTVFEQNTPAIESEASPTIWEDSEAFAEAVASFETAVTELEKVAGADLQTVDSAHRNVGKACKGCHEDFRVKKED